jgi:UDP-N-acetylglucosamine--N-acetylmuramyl-(pentapeptide) pyrophosphoryl-undecaprenol N-acetylglucosamine transferase
MGVLRCMALLREFKPQVVVGVGGYASGPAMMAAILLRIPTLAYEPNATPGLANRMIGRYVSAAAVSFPECASCFRNAEVTGVPVREEIFSVPERPEGAAPRLLIFAGSQGARVFNEMMPRIVRGLLETVPGLTIVHQSGGRHEQETRAAYAASGADPARWTVSAFLTDMKAQYTAADLVLCRSGSSVAELAAAGRPSLLVPYPFAADDHQRKNAEAMAAAGAAVVRIEAGLTAEELQRELIGLLHDPARLRKMGVAARAMARPGAVQRMAEIVERLAKL